MGRLYVAIGKNGLLKVGRSIRVGSRISALRSEFRRFGDVLDRFQTFDEIPLIPLAEDRLIDEVAKAHKRYYGNEWFESGDFEAVVLMASQITQGVLRLGSEYFPRSRPPEGSMGYASRRAAYSAWRDGIKKEKSARSAERAKLRQLRLNEIAMRQLARGA